MMKGIKWGANVSDFPDLVFMGVVDGGKKIYRREGERMNIVEADVVVLYGFFKHRLEDVQIHFRSLANFQKLKEKWFRLYGPGCQANRSKETYHWNGKELFVFLTYDELSGKGAAGCTYVPIYRQRHQMRRNLEDFKGMVEKFKMVKKEVFHPIRR
ncbi:MAG: hypothetical protein ACETWD_11335 [Desulfatiglandales bacterium]